MLGIGEKDADGRQKRIEHRGKYLRVSRTGGASLRAQTKLAGFNLTANSKHGVRVSRRLFKGTNIALQSGKLRLRGRYGKGPTKLNLSKSGVSISTRNKLGTFNWFKPNRSSAKLFGVQFRGKKAANLQMIFLLGSALVWIVKAAFILVVWLLQATCFLVRLTAIGLWKLLKGIGNLLVQFFLLPRTIYQKVKQAQLQRAADDYADSSDLRSWDLSALKALIAYVIVVRGRGEESLLNVAPLVIADQTVDFGQASMRFEQLRAINTRGRDEGSEVRSILMATAGEYARRAAEDQVVELLLSVDERCVADGGRTVLQDVLIDDYCEVAGVSVEAGAA